MKVRSVRHLPLKSSSMGEGGGGWLPGRIRKNFREHDEDYDDDDDDDGDVIGE